ncbi:MAG: MogA/MoaB family molybdenum cofactor biosynthesis protein [Humibacillus sp.]|nr:MogA/MoaB family molybdenum cofactor biosynthesis protein [Humibacillus sp.]MDN5778293.1 MogA/MoaB family molybdenum cofactor biosynthesis protein [Humibacillus sp.]
MSELTGAGYTAVVVTSSNRAAAGVYTDTSGAVIVERLRAWGFHVDDAIVVADGDPFGAALREAIGGAPALVLTTGGTGLTPTDVTPEQTRPVLDRLVPGVAEALRAAGIAKGVPTAMLSRGLVGIAGSTFVANLPGSRGGVRDALDVLEPVLAHVLSQVAGGDHPRS